MTSRTLDDTNPGAGSIADTTYTYERTLDDAVRREMRSAYDTSIMSPMTPHLPFRIRITRRVDAYEVGTAEGVSLDDVLANAERIMEADVTSRPPVEMPLAWWQGAEVVR